MQFSAILSRIRDILEVTYIDKEKMRTPLSIDCMSPMKSEPSDPGRRLIPFNRWLDYDMVKALLT